ncbi:peptidoglycan-associated lipoprotein Pal [Azospirillum canadense]|uniref:peptidoglycan-associated lipoprotein Pal n=1 Tax=Azospirillum canadense TaxID=403962 RepID=UPI002226736A|nr:peptidoglycan-associated lipoprotein Pal [Azospirillum canadense]MCW2239243.1 peptidoglycan-associated lipoprotein [Azospirillum canadense]
MNIKLASLLAAVALLAACDTAPKDSGNGSLNGGANTGNVNNASTVGGPGQVAPGSQQDLVVNVGDRVFFGTDKYDLSAEARATLDRQAQWLKQYSHVTVTVEGHSDERGTREYNLALGDRRANSVRNYMVAQGINPARVKVISFGKEKPAVVGSNQAAWAQNRRGVTVVD